MRHESNSLFSVRVGIMPHFLNAENEKKGIGVANPGKQLESGKAGFEPGFNQH